MGTIFQESNTFAATRTELRDFEALLLRSDATADELIDGTSEVAGVLSTLMAAGVETVPLLFARASPGGQLSAACWAALEAELMRQISDAGDVDAVIVCLHGSMAVEHMHDPEGRLLSRIRAHVGPTVPIVASLDLHANVTNRMVSVAQGLFPYRRYPHDDAWETGERAARFTLRLLDGEPWPAMTLAKIDMLSPAINAATAAGPLAEVASAAERLTAESSPEVLEVSFLHVHPWVDEPEMGNSALVIGGPAAEREALARAVTAELWSQRFRLEASLRHVDEAIEILRSRAGPFVLVDSADCVGGGAAGDTVGALRALVGAAVRGPIYVPAVDPGAAALCCDRGVGATVTTALGHALDPQWGTPLTVSGRVEAVARDRRLTYTGGIYGGLETQMGDCAAIRIDSDVLVLIASRPTYEYADEQFAALGLDVEQARVLVAKNPMNCRTAYASWATQFIDVDLPGATSNRLTNFAYNQGGRDGFPFVGRDPSSRPETRLYSSDREF